MSTAYSAGRSKYLCSKTRVQDVEDEQVHFLLSRGVLFHERKWHVRVLVDLADDGVRISARTALGAPQLLLRFEQHGRSGASSVGFIIARRIIRVGRHLVLRAVALLGEDAVLLPGLLPKCVAQGRGVIAAKTTHSANPGVTDLRGIASRPVGRRVHAPPITRTVLLEVPQTQTEP